MERNIQHKYPLSKRKIAAKMRIENKKNSEQNRKVIETITSVTEVIIVQYNYNLIGAKL